MYLLLNLEGFTETLSLLTWIKFDCLLNYLGFSASGKLFFFVEHLRQYKLANVSPQMD